MNQITQTNKPKTQNFKNFTAKGYWVAIVAFLLLLITVLAPFFTMTKVKYSEAATASVSMNGFAVFASADYEEKIESATGIYIITHFILALNMLLLLVISFFEDTQKKFFVRVRILGVTATVMNAAYFIFGMAYTNAAKKAIGIYAEDVIAGVRIKTSVISVFTWSFVPLAIGIAMIAALFFVQMYPFKVKKAVAPTGAEKLLQYKALLDAGAISQEEFDAKKKEFLG